MIDWKQHMTGECGPMDKKLFKHLILLITYAVVLVVVIVKIDTVAGWLSAILSAFQPLFIGFAVAFVLNRPCNFFCRRVKAIAGRTRRLRGLWRWSPPM